MTKRKKEKRPFFSKIIFLVLILSLVYLYARYIETVNISVKEYSIESKDIPGSFDSFKIVQFSDLELGSTFNIENMQELVDKINAQKADIVVFTGDLFAKGEDITDEKKENVIKYLKEIDASIGKYSIYGDDDVNNKAFDEIMSNADFMDLTNKYELIYYKSLEPIIIYGLDSLTKGHQDLENTFSYPSIDDDEEYLAKFSILLVHEPDSIDDVLSQDLDLVLAGHSHNSEINIPYLKTLYNIDGASKYYDDYYEVGSTKLFISSGIGTSKYHVRLLSHPSISVYKLFKI